MFGSILWSRGDSCSVRFFLLVPSTLALWMGVAGAELDPFLVICNSSCFMCFALLWLEWFWLMRGIRSAELGVGSIFFRILTSLASGGVMIGARFFFCGGRVW